MSCTLLACLAGEHPAAIASTSCFGAWLIISCSVKCAEMNAREIKRTTYLLRWLAVGAPPDAGGGWLRLFSP
jgi:hypothetical protein